MDDRRAILIRQVGALDPRRRRLLARAGWVSVAAAAVGGGGAILLHARGRSLTNGPVVVLILGALVSIALAAQFLGAPIARAGEPSRLKTLLLGVTAAVGIVLAVVASPVIAVGVAYVVYVAWFLAMARSPTTD